MRRNEAIQSRTILERGGGKMHKATAAVFVAAALFAAFIFLSFSGDNADDRDVLAAPGDYFTVGNLEYYIVSEAPYEVSVYAADEISGALTIPGTVFYGSTTYIVKYIGYCAFYDQQGLTSVTIPNSVVEIEDWAFQDCENLVSVTIGASVESIGEGAFFGCTSLTGIVVDPSNTHFEADGGALFTAGKGTLMAYPTAAGAYTIPNSVEYIANYAFANTGLTSVTIPGSVIQIGGRAFAECTDLMEVNFLSPSSLDCIEWAAFSYCEKLESVIIPDSVTYIGENAFAYCENLASVTIGASVEHIDDMAFLCCESLVSIFIPDSVTHIGEWAFAYCKSLTAIDVDPANTNYESADGVLFTGGDTLLAYPAGKLGDYNIPSGTEYIAPYAFIGCEGLTSVTIPGSVIEIGDNAFEECINLTSVTIPDSVEYIGFNAFKSCESLISVTIPDSVTYLGGYVFQWCTSLEYVHIGKSVDKIEAYMFYACTSLTEIDVDPLHLDYKSVDGVVFSKGGETLLVYPRGLFGAYTIPDGTEYINEYAFHYAEGLTAVIIPASVVDIGDYAFQDCENLASVAILGSPAIEFSAFSYCGNLIIISIPSGVMDKEDFSLYSDPVITDGYFICLVPNGGTYVDPMVDAFDDDISEPAAPTKEGYGFVGWYSDAALTTPYLFPDKMPADHVTVYAKWSAGIYEVKYDLNGGTGSAPTESDKATDDKFAAKPADGMIAPANKVFVKWNTAADGSGTSYLPGALVTMPPGGITLYAIWELMTYTVVLTPGTGYTLTAVPPSSSPVAHGGQYTFQFALSAGYTGGQVLVNGSPVELGSDGRGTILGITSIQTVTVTGVTADTTGDDEPDGGSGIDTMIIIAIVVVLAACVAGAAVYFLFIRKP